MDTEKIIEQLIIIDDSELKELYKSFQYFRQIITTDNFWKAKITSKFGSDENIRTIFSIESLGIKWSSAYGLKTYALYYIKTPCSFCCFNSFDIFELECRTSVFTYGQVYAGIIYPYKKSILKKNKIGHSNYDNIDDIKPTGKLCIHDNYGIIIGKKYINLYPLRSKDTCPVEMYDIVVSPNIVYNISYD